MSTPDQPANQTRELLELTLEACRHARQGADAVCRSLTDPSAENLQQIKQSEEELDTIDRRMNEEVTRVVAEGAAGNEAR